MLETMLITGRGIGDFTENIVHLVLHARPTPPQGHQSLPRTQVSVAGGRG